MIYAIKDRDDITNSTLVAFDNNAYTVNTLRKLFPTYRISRNGVGNLIIRSNVKEIYIPPHYYLCMTQDLQNLRCISNITSPKYTQVGTFRTRSQGKNTIRLELVESTPTILGAQADILITDDDSPTYWTNQSRYTLNTDYASVTRQEVEDMVYRARRYVSL